MADMTEEEKRKFWEACGFRWQSYRSEYVGKLKVKVNDAQWIYPSGETHFNLPDFTLDNLFKYAVPKLTYLQVTWANDCKYEVEASIGYRRAVIFNADLALALRDALRQVLKKEAQNE